MWRRRDRRRRDELEVPSLTLNTIAGRAVVLAYEFAEPEQVVRAFTSYKEATRGKPTLFSAIATPPAAFGLTLQIVDGVERQDELHARALPFVAAAQGQPTTAVRGFSPTLLAAMWAGAVLGVGMSPHLVADEDRVLTDPDGSIPELRVA